MATYQIPVVLNIQANSYDDAVDYVCNHMTVIDSQDESWDAAEIPSHEHDSEGQRVIYLHPENVPNE